jgi:hypothetical protein
MPPIVHGLELWAAAHHQHGEAPWLHEWPVGDVGSDRGDGLTLGRVADLLRCGRSGPLALLGASTWGGCVVCWSWVTDGGRV